MPRAYKLVAPESNRVTAGPFQPLTHTPKLSKLKDLASNVGRWRKVGDLNSGAPKERWFSKPVGLPAAHTFRIQIVIRSNTNMSATARAVGS